MENFALAQPDLDLFGEMVVIQRRCFTRRPKPEPVMRQQTVQLGFLDVLEMSEEALEVLRSKEEITDDYVQWLREYLLKMTLRQITHRQASDATRSEAIEWVESDSEHPFSFKTCCVALMVDWEDVRNGVLLIARKAAR